MGRAEGECERGGFRRGHAAVRIGTWSTQQRFASGLPRLVACGLNERARRLFAAAEARTAGYGGIAYGGIAASSRATGVAQSTIGRGLKDLDDPASLSGEVRRPGSGRPALTKTDATLLEDLRQLLEPATKGDPMRLLRWVSKSHAKLAAALCAMGHRVSKSTVPKLLAALQYRRQVNCKTLARRSPCRPPASRSSRLTRRRKSQSAPTRTPAATTGRKAAPSRSRSINFVDAELGKVVPYGVYDIAANAGCVSVGIDDDTAQFSVNSIRRWLHLMGRERYPDTDKLMITADGGGSNGSRVRLFKVELQKLADETRLALQVCHYPPGTSKWNKIEHRLFCYITENWRGTPLTSRTRGCRAHRRHHDQGGPEGAVRARHPDLPKGHQGQ